MDAFTLATGVFSTISLAIQVLDGLVKYYESFKDQADATASTTARLKNLSHFLQSLRDTLEDPSSQIDSETRARIEGSIKHCESRIFKLREEYEKFIKTSSSSGLKPSLRFRDYHILYPFHEHTLERLDGEIGQIRENLSFVVEVVELRNQGKLQSDVSNLQSLAESIRLDQISGRTRKWLNAPDPTVEHNTAVEKRHPGTGLWLVQGDDFQNWMNDTNSFLWLKGFAGCGKSVLCSTVIQHTLEEKQNHLDVGITFFYFTFVNDEKRDVIGMLRTILLQLASQLPNGNTILEGLYKTYQPGVAPTKNLIFYIRHLIGEFRDVYIFIDAVDESPRGEQRERVLDAIQTLRQQPIRGLHVLCTARDETDIAEHFKSARCKEIVLKNSRIDEDIRNFIWGKLATDPGFQKWKKHHARIGEVLAQRAEGVFRWVECQFRTIKQSPRSKNALEDCLSSLPCGLDETYERILCAIPKALVAHTRRLLTLLCFSGRPLTVDEIQEAIAVSIEDPIGVDNDSRFEDEESLQEICPGLIEFYDNVYLDYDGSKEVCYRGARIAHFSVQEYLESDRIGEQRAAQYAISISDAHVEIAQICCIYLKEPGLSVEEITEQTLDDYPLSGFAAEFWYHHYTRASAETRGQLQNQMLEIFKSLPEAFHTWIRLHDPDNADESMNLHRKASDIPSPVYYASLLGLDFIVQKLIAGYAPADKALINSIQSGRYGTPLQAASFEGHERTIQILLDNGADVNIQLGFGYQYYNAIQAASAAGCAKAVKMLLENGADVNSYVSGFNDPLQSASYQGHENVVKLLLMRGADVNPKHRGHYTALSAASRAGHERVVTMLLASGAELDTLDQVINGRFRNALINSSERGQLKTVEMLLAGGADVNFQAGWNGNALVLAAERGHVKVVKTLLKNGANVNVHGSMRITALVAAATEDHAEIVHLLLDAGAEVDVPSDDFGTALHVASTRGKENIVKMLLEYGAEVDLPSRGSTALEAASELGYREVVQLLIDHGARVKLRSVDSLVLQDSSVLGREETTQMLLDRWGTSGKARSKAVDAKLRMGRKKMLLDNGADPSNLDDAARSTWLLHPPLKSKTHT